MPPGADPNALVQQLVALCPWNAAGDPAQADALIDQMPCARGSPHAATRLTSSNLQALRGLAAEAAASVFSNLEPQTSPAQYVCNLAGAYSLWALRALEAVTNGSPVRQGQVAADGQLLAVLVRTMTRRGAPGISWRRFAAAALRNAAASTLAAAATVSAASGGGGVPATAVVAAELLVDFVRRGKALEEDHWELVLQLLARVLPSQAGGGLCAERRRPRFASRVPCVVCP
ncbi:hypothetical protein MNEG_9301 [Monoraphidium neglectum]|jgi:hypothetical protein|uniref:Uncharacterized protein n=1 Tax=Monoraphidium neglectum TaxID=145388 RepID=A0A0D2M5D5_9CHLO|nr:hypothetical protein MNEG_9301 [Monoraphidium neglectum]KIY98664.1 hypothetical protein MNEG_9301 [Monoraphidium neglectum]|eukprot:XP_013897684.1 hypothetical protein MNEG_9301 [Monoraphidium neglectum]